MYEKLPQELKERGAFCLWKYDQWNGDTTKVPYQANSLRGDSTSRAAFTNSMDEAAHTPTRDRMSCLPGCHRPTKRSRSRSS